jgi:hypothetical protein
MVSGAGLDVTPTPWVSQWAETQRIALGRGRAWPIAAQPRRKSLSSMAFIGEPWPMKSTGMRAATSGMGGNSRGMVPPQMGARTWRS